MNKNKIKKHEKNIENIKIDLYKYINDFILINGYSDTERKYKINNATLTRIRNKKTVKIETLLKICKKLFDK